MLIILINPMHCERHIFRILCILVSWQHLLVPAFPLEFMWLSTWQTIIYYQKPHPQVANFTTSCTYIACVYSFFYSNNKDQPAYTYHLCRGNKITCRSSNILESLLNFLPHHTLLKHIQDNYYYIKNNWNKQIQHNWSRDSISSEQKR